MGQNSIALTLRTVVSNPFYGDDIVMNVEFHQKSTIDQVRECPFDKPSKFGLVGFRKPCAPSNRFDFYRVGHTVRCQIAVEPGCQTIGQLQPLRPLNAREVMVAK